ncbi:MAG: DUF5678 domain-containing protein [Elusimicrobiota bacterium]
MKQVLIKEKKYNGQYVAVKNFNKPVVIANGQNPEKVYKDAIKKGIQDPILIFVPSKNMVQIIPVTMQKFNKVKKIVLFSSTIVGLIFSFPKGNLCAKTGEIVSKMEEISKQFDQDYISRHGAVVPVPLAVIPFQTDEKLTKKK